MDYPGSQLWRHAPPAVPFALTWAPVLLPFFCAVSYGEGALYVGTCGAAGPQAAWLQGTAVVLLLCSNLLPLPEVSSHKAAAESQPRPMQQRATTLHAINWTCLQECCRPVAGLDDLRCIVTIIVLISTMLCFLTCAVQTVCCAGSSRTTCC